MSDFISGAKARELIENHEAVLIDVRNPQEFASGSATGATNIPVSNIAQATKDLHPEQHFVVFCLSGARSSIAKMILDSLGFSNVGNVGTLQNFNNS